MSTKRKSVPKSLRKIVWDKYVGRDKGKALCYCCKHEEISQFDFHCGHVIAQSDGGSNDIENLRPICSGCNGSMGKQNLEEFKAVYHPSSSFLNFLFKKLIEYSIVIFMIIVLYYNFVYAN